MNRRHFILGSATASLTACSGATLESNQLNALKSGGHVIYFRHAATTFKGVDKVSWPRSEQRLLSDFGKLQSRTIGAAFKQRGIPVAKVLSSPFHRCMDMAEIAFGGFEVDDGLLSAANDVGTADVRVAYLRKLMATPRTGQGNLVLISHNRNIKNAADISLNEGEAAVIRPLGSNAFGQVAVVPFDGW